MRCAAIVWATVLKQPSDYLICKVHLNPSQIRSVWSRGHADRNRWCRTPLFKNMEMHFFNLLKVVRFLKTCSVPSLHCRERPEDTNGLVSR